MRVPWILLAMAAAASAHTLQITGVTVALDREAVSVTVVAHLPMLGGADPAVEIPRRLRARVDGQPFLPEGVTISRDPAYDTVTWTGRRRRAAGSLALEAPLFPDHPEDTTVVLVYRDGRMVERTALNAAHPRAVLGESNGAVARRFLEMGFTHILSGPDHVLFLLGLLLTGGPLLRLLGVVTAFTLAHSITLTCTALGIASLSPRIVEPLIAVSIIAVGVENLIGKRHGTELRVWLAFGFGFFHGFGFAGALAESGLPAYAIGWSLASFHLGVEIGQACVVAPAALGLWLLRRRHEGLTALAVRYASGMIVVSGGVWLFARVWR